MKKQMLGIFLVLTVILPLAGCASNGEDPGREPVPDDSVYIGEYLERDTNEPGLEIAKADSGGYIVQISIFRLTSLSDGIGELSADGMTFTATDAAGNPIGGTIVVDERLATVTFTDSSWDGLPAGSDFEYTKSSDTPSIWN